MTEGEFGFADYTESVTRVGRKTRVFISYSRVDKEFANGVVAALEQRGLDAYLYTKDILPGENWRGRLSMLILSADSVVFIISPDSVASPICSWEVDYAERAQKRIIPIVWRRAEEVSNKLSSLNYIFFDQENVFERSLEDLSRVIETDISWLREHTRLTEAAFRWQNDRFGEGHALLRGPDLRDAELWLERRPATAPEPGSM